MASTGHSGYGSPSGSGTPSSSMSALRELEQVADEARNDRAPVPSPAAHRNARRLIEKMYRLCRNQFAVYPLYDGEIVIEAVSADRDSVLVVCRSAGEIGCFVNLDGCSRQERYADVSALPNRFLREALRELARRAPWKERPAEIGGSGAGVGRVS